MIARRKFLRGMFAAPAIVTIGNIMPVKLVDWTPPTSVSMSQYMTQITQFTDTPDLIYCSFDYYRKFAADIFRMPPTVRVRRDALMEIAIGRAKDRV